MTLHPKPEANVPLQDEEDTSYMSMLEAAANTARLLADAGLNFDTTDDDLDDAAATVRQAARAPQVLQTKVAQQALTKKTPAALLLTASILKDYGHKIVEEASQVRHMVVNKLIQETDNPDPRIRVKALELLGKVSDVGLFTEKQEITVTHQTTDDLRARLRRKLEKLTALPPAEEADYVDVTPEEE
jgi:hypothetical protein